MGHLAMLFTLQLFFLSPTFWGRQISQHTKRHEIPSYTVLKDIEAVTKSTVGLSDIDIIQDSLDEVMAKEKIKEKWSILISSGGVVNVDSSNPNQGLIVKFEKSDGITLQEAFHFMKFYPLLFGSETMATIFEIPIGSTYKTFKLTKKPDGKTFSLSQVNGKTETNFDAKSLGNAVDKLKDGTLHRYLKDTLIEVMPEAANGKLDSQPDFEAKLKNDYDRNGAVTDAARDEAFRAAVEVMISSCVLEKDLPDSSPAWLTGVKKDFNDGIAEVRNGISQDIKQDAKTELSIEFTASMLETKENAIKEWNDLKTNGVITEGTVDQRFTVKISETKELTLKKLFRLLQFYPDIYKGREKKHTSFKVPIGGKVRKFRLAKSAQGKHQISVYSYDADWPETTKRGGKGLPSYDVMVDRVLQKFPNHKTLAETMVTSVDKTLREQPNFENVLEVGGVGPSTADTVRATVEFLIISMVAEAAQPADEFKTNFIKQLVIKIRAGKRFPKPEDLPKLVKLKGPTGRTPAMDEIVRNGLDDVLNGKRKFHEAFGSSEFPTRDSRGTKKGRQLMHKKGSEIVTAFASRKRAAQRHDHKEIEKKLEELSREYCGGTRRVKRASCSLEDRNAVTVDEDSIKITDQKVEFDIVDRRKAEERKHMTLSLEDLDLATPKLIQEHIVKSRTPGATRAYAKINKGLAIHGLIFSVLGAADYFSNGENIRGGFSLSQSVHTLGGLTGFNEIVSKVGKRILINAAKGVAKGLNLEKGLARFSNKVEKFMEKGAGKMLGDIPGVGLVFDVYFIEQDVEELAELDLNNSEDVKLLPLRVVDLVIDIDITILNLIGTFCPAAEVITEPLVIILSIIRMAIDDFYIDIMDEMEKVNWKSPWAGLQFLGALVKGSIEGAADFFTGGLRRQMESYRKQEQHDKKLVRNLTKFESYYKIVGKTEGDHKTIDFTEGMLSSFGGYINFRLLDNNHAMLEIGDVSGPVNDKHHTIQKTFKIDPNINDIVLGLGESRAFTYKHKTAKLWFVIPIKSYKVICGANMHEKSVYGTYYGNSKNNTFYAVQKPDSTTKTPSKDEDNAQEECNFGNLNVKFETGNYHYNLYGRGGSDTFYLGPELSTVTGGEGTDVYIIQSDGGKTIIDNFAEDEKRDIVVINVDYDNIECHQSRKDVDIIYSKSHHIRIKNWFTPGNVNYYRHVTFRSKDGVIFVPKETSTSRAGNAVQCSAVALDLSSAKASQRASLTDSKFMQVKQVTGSNETDNIVGNDINNILDGGRGADHLSGGKDEDTYIIRAKEGCDTIDNNAEDFLNTTDILVFEVPFDEIEVRTRGNDLSVTDRNNPQTSCFTVSNWLLGYQYRHILFTSSDYVVFNVTTSTSGSVTKVPIMLDYKTSDSAVCVDLSDSSSQDCIKPPGFAYVATISDSPLSDHIVGNAQSNFLSCSGGEDFLEGGEGSDNYVVKASCTKATINNFDSRKKSDLLYIDATFGILQSQKHNSDLRIITKRGTPEITIRSWFESNESQHLGIRTADGITLRIGEDGQLEPIEVSKDPNECRCKNSECNTDVITYNLTEAPWTSVIRFQLKSSHCSYNIYGNNLNNYLDPGAGNGYNYQHLAGRGGSDTYVLSHGYGEFNEINNFADDNMTDIVQFGVEFEDIGVYFHAENDVILASKSRSSSLSVRILDYFRSNKYQHLQIVTANKVTFEIMQEHPYRKVISVDRTHVDSPQNISFDTNPIITHAEDLKGSLLSTNELSGTDHTREIDGGFQGDILRGGNNGTVLEGKEGNDNIYGGAGNDIIFGGDGDDAIHGGAGDDHIYGGNGKDIIDGGDGSDTLVFSGDGFRREGVRVDLNIGFGKKVDAEGDKYLNVENVYGTIHDDVLVGSFSNNKLYGLDGNDTFIVLGGDDLLVGGEGKDLYILHQASGVKVIDNYAEDEVEDTLSLLYFNSADLCVFLVGNDLHLQVAMTNVASALYHGRHLSITMINWKVSEKYRHMKIAFNDTLWEGVGLSGIISKFYDLENSVNYVTTGTNLRVTSKYGTKIRFAWRKNDSVLPYPNTKLYLINFNRREPQNVHTTPVNSQTSSVTVMSLESAAHYVFALVLKKCNATVAVSYTLTTFGRERNCHAAQVQYSNVQCSPGTVVSTPNHGTIATVTCNTGYTIEDRIAARNSTCIDKEWIPSLPTCNKIQQCSTPMKPTNGEVSAAELDQGSKAHYVCHKGYRLSGPKERTCIYREFWSGTDPDCQPLNCPRQLNVSNEEFYPCSYMTHANMYGTIDSPLEGYCIRLQCSNSNYRPSHELQGKIYGPRWESDWNIPQGGRVCSDGKWIGYVDDKCEPTSKLFHVEDEWNKKKGLLILWENGAWNVTSSPPNNERLRLSCKSVGIDDPQHLTYTLNKRLQIKVACTKLRLVAPKPTRYEGKIEVLNNDGQWEGVCLTETGTQPTKASDEICYALGFNFTTSVVRISTGASVHKLSCNR
jgi:Ca2+-binding RTX toxin-like protein